MMAWHELTASVTEKAGNDMWDQSGEGTKIIRSSYVLVLQRQWSALPLIALQYTVNLKIKLQQQQNWYGRSYPFRSKMLC